MRASHERMHGSSNGKVHLAICLSSVTILYEEKFLSTEHAALELRQLEQ